VTNPLLEPGVLPAFSKISPEMIVPAITELIAQNRIAIDGLARQENPDWGSLIEPLELMNDLLEKAWSPVSHLNSVKSSTELRAAYNNCLPLLSEYATEVSQNREWRALNAAARKQILTRLNSEEQEQHILAKPKDSRHPYILSATPEDDFVRDKKTTAYAATAGILLIFSVLVLLTSMRSPFSI
jgi:Zn-dependent oligopeptidase